MSTPRVPSQCSPSAPARWRRAGHDHFERFLNGVAATPAKPSATPSADADGELLVAYTWQSVSVMVGSRSYLTQVF
jgi:hypothetical protein